MERIADAKRYFVEREDMAHRNAKRIGEFNEALERGWWVSQIIWTDQDRKGARLAQALQQRNRRPLALRRPGKGVAATMLGLTTQAPHAAPERTHSCIPPWWLWRGPDLQVMAADSALGARGCCWGRGGGAVCGWGVW